MKRILGPSHSDILYFSFYIEVCAIPRFTVFVGMFSAPLPIYLTEFCYPKMDCCGVKLISVFQVQFDSH